MRHSKVNILEVLLMSVVVALALWPSYLSIKIQGIPNINITRIFIFVLVVMWVGGLCISQNYRRRFVDFLVENKSVLYFLIVPFFCWKLITAGIALNKLPAIFSALKDTIYCLGLFVLSVNVWRSFEQVERLVQVVLLISAVVFLITLVEVINQRNVFAEFVPDAFVLADKLRKGIVRDSTYRAWGTFSHPIALAGYCVTVLPLVVWYAVNGRAKARIVGYGISILLIVIIYFSRSRVGLAVLVFMAAGFFVCSFLPKWISRARFRARGVIAIISAILILLTLLGSWYALDRLASGRTAAEAGSSSVRLLQMELGLPLIRSRPFGGYGPGEAANVLGMSNTSVDNYYLSLALESGLTEVILFIFIFLYFLRFSWKLQRKLPAPYAHFAVAIFWLIAGNMLFLTVVSLEQTLPFIFLMFGLLISLKSMEAAGSGDM